MSNVNFSTPIIHDYQANSWKQSISHFIEEKTDAYFSLTRGYKAYIISPHQTEQGEYHIELRKGKESLFWKVIANALKIASWFTVVAPLCMLTIKFLYRFERHLYPIAPMASANKDDSAQVVAAPVIPPAAEISGDEDDAFKNLPFSELDDENLQEFLLQNAKSDFILPVDENSVVRQASKVEEAILPLIQEQESQKLEEAIVEEVALPLISEQKNQRLEEDQPLDEAVSFPEVGVERGLNDSWLVVDREISDEEVPRAGSLAHRIEFYFDLFASKIAGWTNPDQEAIKQDILGMLDDDPLTTKIEMEKPYLLDKNGNEFKEVTNQLWIDCNRFNKISINDQVIYHPRQSSSRFDWLASACHNLFRSSEVPTDEEVRRNVISKMLANMDGKLLDKISAWMHQSLHVKNIGELQTGINDTSLDPGFHALSNSGGYDFKITTQGSQVQIEGSLAVVIRDAFPSLYGRDFEDRDQYNLTKGITVGYLNIYKRITVPIQELLDYNREQGSELPNLKVDQIVTPLFTSASQASKALDKAILNLPVHKIGLTKSTRSVV